MHLNGPCDAVVGRGGGNVSAATRGGLHSGEAACARLRCHHAEVRAATRAASSCPGEQGADARIMMRCRTLDLGCCVLKWAPCQLATQSSPKMTSNVEQRLLALEQGLLRVAALEQSHAQIAQLHDMVSACWQSRRVLLSKYPHAHVGTKSCQEN